MEQTYFFETLTAFPKINRINKHFVTKAIRMKWIKYAEDKWLTVGQLKGKYLMLCYRKNANKKKRKENKGNSKSLLQLRMPMIIEIFVCILAPLKLNRSILLSSEYTKLLITLKLS